MDKGYQQVVWTDDNTHEYIEEAGAMNIFIRINDTLLTSPVSDRILDGVTRKSVIEIAKSEGIPVEIRKIRVAELITAAKNGTLMEMFGAGHGLCIAGIEQQLCGTNQETYYRYSVQQDRGSFRMALPGIVMDN